MEIIVKQTISMIALLLAAATARADIYKCAGPDGKTLFSDAPCAGAEVVKIKPARGDYDPDAARRLRAQTKTLQAQQAEEKKKRQAERVAQQGNSSTGEEIFLSADNKGQFHAEGQINGEPIRFFVDTGAALVTIRRADAQRLKIDLTRATPDRAQGAGGTIGILRVKLDSVSVGGIEVNDVEGAVVEDANNPPLLGMSFLQHLEMKSEGNRMQLKKREHMAARQGNSRADKEISLSAGKGGVFYAEGQINGKPAHFIIDTGATYVSIGRSDAKRFKIDLTRAEPGQAQAVSGTIKTLRVKLDSVSIGGIQINDVEGVVHEDSGLPILLGMSFLQHLEMKRDGNRMQLKERF
jgi:clan AA aspartic protease (TIGR02281 family)